MHRPVECPGGWAELRWFRCSPHGLLSQKPLGASCISAGTVTGIHTLEFGLHLGIELVGLGSAVGDFGDSILVTRPDLVSGESRRNEVVPFDRRVRRHA